MHESSYNQKLTCIIVAKNLIKICINIKKLTKVNKAQTLPINENVIIR
jgi:hypothetical protein